MIQIREREAAAAHDRDVVQRQEQERRLESELKLKAVINEEKEQKSKDAEEYRKFLLGQVPNFVALSLVFCGLWHKIAAGFKRNSLSLADAREEGQGRD